MDDTCTVENLTKNICDGKHFANPSAAVRYAKGRANDDVYSITRNADGTHVAYVSRDEIIDYTVGAGA